MKFFGIATLIGTVASTNVPVQIPTGLDGIGAFLSNAGASGIFGATDFSQVMQHGCHCKKFGGFDVAPQGGQPVDALDAECKTYWERRSCIKLQGGTCSAYHSNGGNYPATHYTATATLGSGGLQLNADPNFHCQAVTDPCLRDICLIDHASLLVMVGGGMGTASWNWDFTNQCVGGRGIPNVDIPSFTCVGSGADATWAYKAEIPTRVEHANDFFTQAATTGLFGSVAMTEIMNHGCHCKKLGDHEAEHQGGTRVVDDLDKLCRIFFMKRSCVKSNKGFSGSCGEGVPADSYHAALRVTDVERSSNGDQFPGMFEWFADRQKHCSLQEESTCLSDICNIDHDSIYNGLMAAGTYTNTYGYIATDDCPENTSGPKHRVCTGHAPDVIFQVVDDQDPYELVAQMIVDSYPDSVRNRLASATGEDIDTIISKLQTAYAAGRSAVTAEELEAIQTAINNDDSEGLNAIIQENKQQLGAVFQAIAQEFGSSFPVVQDILIAHRMGHYVNGQDLYQNVLDAMLSSFSDDLISALQNLIGDSAMEMVRNAYLQGRSAVPQDELLQFQDALNNGDGQRMNELMNTFMAELGPTLNQIGAAFGSNFQHVLSLIQAERLGHLENGIDLYEVVVNLMIDSFDGELVTMLENIAGDDVLLRLRGAYGAGRAVVDGDELREIHAALTGGDLAEVQRLMADFKNQLGAAMDQIAATFGDDFEQVENLIEAYRMDHLDDGNDLYAVVIESMVDALSPIHNKLEEIAGVDVLDRLRSAYAEGRHVVSGDDLRRLQAALNDNNLPRVNELMQQFITAMGSAMDEIAADFGDDFDEVLSLIQAFRMGHLDENGNDIFATVVNMMIDSYEPQLIAQLEFIIGADVLDRLRNAYEQGRSVVDGQELQDLKTALTEQNLPEVHRLMEDLKQQLGTRLDAIAAAFGDGWDEMTDLIAAYRLDHIDEEGQDLFAIVIELMIDSYSEIHAGLEAIAGPDVLNRLRLAYAQGRSVVSGDDLRELNTALENNNLVRVQELMQQFITAMGANMAAVSDAFGNGFDEVLRYIQAFRMGHLDDEGNDLYATVVNLLISQYPAPLVIQLENVIGDDVIEKLRNAYDQGRPVIDGDELRAIKAALDNGDLPEVNRLVTEAKEQLGAAMDDIAAAFGAGWDRMVQLIEAFRLGHLVNNQDLYEVAVNIILDAFDDDLIASMEAVAGDNVIDRLRTAYFAGRSVVNTQELLDLKAALDNQDFPEVHRLITALKEEMGDAMDDVAAAFGTGFTEVENLIAAWRMGHLDDGQDLFGVVVELMINSYSDIHSRLAEIAGADVLDRLREAYRAGRTVVSGDDLRELQTALSSDPQDLTRVNELMTQIIAAMGTRMQAVADAFGDDFDAVLDYITAFRAGHLDQNGDDLYAFVVNMIIESYDEELENMLIAVSSTDVLDRLRHAYNAGRHVVNRQELVDLKAALDSQNWPELQRLMAALKAEMGTAMDEVAAAFGDDFDAVESLIEAWRMDHLEDGQDLFGIVVELMINSYSDIHPELEHFGGYDVLDKLRAAYHKGRSVVSGDLLRELKAALDSGSTDDLIRVNELMAEFITALGQNMVTIAAEFGEGFNDVMNYIAAYRADHLTPQGVDMFGMVIDRLINSYPDDLVLQLETEIGSDVMDRLTQAYFRGRSVVNRTELLELGRAVIDGDLQRQHELIEGFKQEFAQHMDSVRAAFGEGFDRAEEIIRNYRTSGGSSS